VVCVAFAGLRREKQIESYGAARGRVVIWFCVYCDYSTSEDVTISSNHNKLRSPSILSG
jgi:hypothetical protein